MHLRSLRLRGFKSFADTVDLVFERGVSVIVGPNGSGKSNVAEALQWAMASQPPSELRLDVAADVLFNGSARRGPSALCEVELVLDNEDGRFGTGRPEVSVMRRLRRDGESAYLLNRVAVRRLDVQEALADAGLGRELHAIVSQGRVEEILLSRPSDRRGFIEEAAGLGKYKRRRHRALAKLARVELNLVRARDLEGELRARLRPLALQATAAERAALLASELAGARLELAGSQIAAARRERVRLTGDLERARADRDALEAAITTAVAEREQAERELAGLVSEQDRASRSYWGLARGLDRLAERRDGLVERSAGLADDRRRLLGRATTFEEEATNGAALARRAADEAEALAVAVAAHVGADDEAALAATQDEARLALDAALAARRTLAELDGRSARAAREVDELSERAAAAGRRVLALKEPSGSGDDPSIATEALRRAEGELAEAVALGEGAQVALANALAVAVAARDEERRARSSLAEAAASRRAADARVEAAERALGRGDGIAPASRRLREAGVALALDLVAAPADLEVALAAALHWRVGEAIAPAVDAAVSLLADEGTAGGVLLCLDRQPRRQQPSVGVPLASLVTLRPGAPDGLLDGIALLDEAADLTRITTGLGVVRDGRGFDADRGLAFRAPVQGGALLALRRERDEAVARAGEAATVAAASEQVARAAAETLQAADAAEGAARTALQQLRTRIDVLGRVVGEATRLAEAASRARERLAERLAAASEEQTRLGEEAEAVRVEAVTLAAQRGEAELRAATAVATHEATAARQAVLAERVAHRRAEVAAARERADRTRADRERFAAAAERAAGQASRCREWAVALARLEAMVPTATDLLTAAAERVEELREPERARLEALERRGSELAAALTACSAREQELARHSREVTGRATALEVSAATAEERLADDLRRRRELAEESGIEPIDRVEPLAREEEATLALRIERLGRRLDLVGPVNPLARDEHAEARERHEETATQIADLEGAIRELRRLIRDLSTTIAEEFATTYAEVERNFGEIVETLFPGGRGRLRLVEPEPDVEEVGQDDDGTAAPPTVRAPGEPGVELEVSPAGKQITRLAILSGGEKALAAIAFLFAIMLARPCPFYVLDEVDAALDDANVERFLALVDRFRDHAQFIVITHQKRTMEAADVLYGVTMAGDGISKVVSRRLPRDAAAERGRVLDRAPAPA